MAVLRLDHVNIRTPVCEQTKDFFVDIVGLEVGFRPPFTFGGYWLYAGDQPVIHLTDALTRGPREEEARGSAAVDHISFRMSGFREIRERIEGRGLRFLMQVVPRTGDVQLFVDDPNGVNVELVFAGAEVTPEEKFTAGTR